MSAVNAHFCVAQQLLVVKNELLRNDDLDAPKVALWYNEQNTCLCSGGKSSMYSFLNLLKAFEYQIVLGQFLLWLILLFYVIRLSRKLGAIMRHQGRTFKEAGGTANDSSTTESSEAISDLRAKIEKLSEQQREQALSLSNCIQKIGLVRFNAFDDVGGEQSFVLVLLNGNGDGIAVSSLYGRQDSRLYAKGIVNGEGERPLSDEERRALQQALPNSGFAGSVRATAGM